MDGRFALGGIGKICERHGPRNVAQTVKSPRRFKQSEHKKVMMRVKQAFYLLFIVYWAYRFIAGLSKIQRLSSKSHILSKRADNIQILLNRWISQSLTLDYVMLKVRTSYLPTEIGWGQRLAPLVTYHKENGIYKIDYTQFHNTLPVSMPECSAKEWSLIVERRRPSVQRHLPAEDYCIEFTTLTRSTRPASRIFGKLLRRRGRKTSRRRSVDLTGERGGTRSWTTTMAATTVQDSPERRRSIVADRMTRGHRPDIGNVVWTVADPTRPISTLANTLRKRPAHSPPSRLEQENKSTSKRRVVVETDNNNNNNDGSIKRRLSTTRTRWKRAGSSQA